VGDDVGRVGLVEREGRGLEARGEIAGLLRVALADVAVPASAASTLTMCGRTSYSTFTRRAA